MKLSQKQKKSIIIPIIGGVIFTGIVGFLAFADRIESTSSTISSWDIQATLEDDGDLHVIDTIKFKSEDYHFFEYEIGYRKNIIQGTGNQSWFDTDSVKVSVYNNDNHYYFNNQSLATSNASDYWKYADCLGFSWNEGNCEDGGYDLDNYVRGTGRELIYVYLHNGLDETLYLKYEYTIKNAVNKYEDITELNWNFASPLEDMACKNVTLTLNLPDGSDNYQVVESLNEEGIIAFGHGNGKSEFISMTSKEIKTKTSSLSSVVDEKLELRVVIPNAPYDIFENVSSDNMISLTSQTGKEVMIKTEEKIAAEDEEYARLYNYALVKHIGFNILIIIGAVLVFLLLYFKFDKERKPIFDAEYLREPPSNDEVGVVSYLINDKEIGTDAFNATLMNIIRKKYIKVESNGAVLIDEDANYCLSIDNEPKSREALTQSEMVVYNLLFKTLFPQGRFTMEDLEKVLGNENVASNYMNAINNWKNVITKDAKNKKYFDTFKTTSLFVLVGIIGLSWVGQISFESFMVYYLPAYLLILTFLSMTLCLFILVYSSTIVRKSKTGIEEYTKWMAFKKFLMDFSHFEDYDVMSIIIWEKYLIYATVFGIADLVEKQLRVKIKEMQDNGEIGVNEVPYFYHYRMSYFSRRMIRMSTIANATVIAAKAKKAAAAAGKVSGGGRFGGSSSFGGGGHGGRAG